VITAPGLEVAPVISVSLESGWGFGCGDEGLRLLDQFFKAGCLRGKKMNMWMHGVPIKEAQLCGIPETGIERWT
jgi:hypothetical protein